LQKFKKNYHDQLAQYYSDKIAFLKEKIASWKVEQIIVEEDIRNSEDFIAGSEAYKEVYTDSFLRKIADYGIKLHELANKEDQTYLYYLNTIITTTEKSQNLVATELAAIPANIDKETFDSKTKQISLAIAEEEIESLGQKGVDTWSDYRRKRNAKIDALITFNAQKARDDIKLDIASLKSQINIPAPQPVVVKPTPLNNIRCSTMRLTSGESVTNCTAY
jgi:hypothetical protein